MATKSVISGEDFALKLRAAEKSLLTHESSSVIAALESQNLVSPVLIRGEDAVRLRRLTHWIRDRLFSLPGRESHFFFSSDLTTTHANNRLRESLALPSLFAAEKLVVVNDAVRMKSAPLKELCALATDSKRISLLILVSIEKEQRNKASDLSSNVASIVDVEKLTGNKLLKAIEREAITLGMTAGILENASATLVRMFEGDFSAISHELARLSLLLNETEPLTEDFVKRNVSALPEQTNFDLFAMIARKTVPGALWLAQQLLDEGQHPLQILGAISKTWRVLLAAKLTQLARRTGSEGSLPSSFANPWYVKRVSAHARDFSVDDLLAGMTLLGRTDVQLKSSSLRPTDALLLLIQRLAGRQFSVVSRAGS